MWRYAERIRRRIRAGKEICLAFAECAGKGSGLCARKGAVAVIKKNRDWLFAPRGGENQVYGVISIYVARFDDEAAYGGKKVKRLPSDVGKFYLNRVVGTGARVLSGLNAGEVWTTVAVEI
ncbi:MAG: hypothetical protein WBY73_12725, partial [Candidatus Acidiferrales bacterium]